MIITGYGILAAFVVLSIAFASAALIFSYIVHPKNPTAGKKSPYECGMNLLGESRVQFNVKYYMYALLFIVFDVEAVFLFPWAVAYNKLGFYALIEAFVFIAILFIGLIYAWKKDILKWQ